MIVNLTARVLRIYAADRPDGIDDLDLGLRQVIDPEPQPAQLDPIPTGSTYRDDMPVELLEYGHVDNLPSPLDGVSCAVSLEVALSQAPRREDLLVPYQEVLTSDGTVIGYRSLAQPI
ncbi:hypothetical protein [Streptomyces sp. NBC_01483]|uniref:hypothetical protein n=1 Tax=Streptomyces sp. NBC_01483 TaxID=2903883 RepID=UPI002E2F3D6F|nr:hypothetical protein [Streptomyces sp. NBC_01483]